ncbi:hypothetical protein GCM10020254_19860 [Streptomyces goshikiensis]
MPRHISSGVSRWVSTWRSAGAAAGVGVEPDMGDLRCRRGLGGGPRRYMSGTADAVTNMVGVYNYI